jgi:hypothetical protein
MIAHNLLKIIILSLERGKSGDGWKGGAGELSDKK